MGLSLAREDAQQFDDFSVEAGRTGRKARVLAAMRRTCAARAAHRKGTLLCSINTSQKFRFVHICCCAGSTVGRWAGPAVGTLDPDTDSRQLRTRGRRGVRGVGRGAGPVHDLCFACALVRSTGSVSRKGALVIPASQDAQTIGRAAVWLSPGRAATRRILTVIRPALTKTRARPTAIDSRPTATRRRVTVTSPTVLIANRDAADD